MEDFGAVGDGGRSRRTSVRRPSLGKDQLDLEALDFPAQIQLNRTNLIDRLQLENKLNTKSFRVLHFFLLFATFVTCLATYDPVQAIADVHSSLGQKYRVGTLSGIQDIDGIIDYLEFFISTTYTLASALIDANTMNSIDPQRCFADSVSDICQMAYWAFPGYNASAPNFVNATETLAGTGHTGLQQGRPVVLESRKDYPHALVVPLAPVVWQSRALSVPCGGFGHIYNEQVLAAGNCAPNTDCDEPRMSSFDFPYLAVPGQESSRQSLFLTYEEAAFTCIDHSKPAVEFRDKSWFPNAMWADLNDGTLLEPVESLGELVWFKFVSDVAYLQAPTDLVVDGRRLGWGDPMWDAGRVLEEGSTRQRWNEQYLRTGRRERKNTFVTRETKSVKIAALVLVPTGAGQPDLFTLIKVTFDVSAFGVVKGHVLMSSIVGTEDAWYRMVAVAILVSLFRIADKLEVTKRCRRSRGQPHGKEVFKVHGSKTLQFIDVLLPTAAIVYLIVAVVVDLSPPHVADELTEAFFANAQDEYFEAFRNILAYSGVQMNLKQSGFIICMGLLFRALHMLTIHPRFEVVLDALGRSSSDILHIVLAVFPILLLLAFLAFWMFGTQSEGGGPFGSFGNAIRNLLPFIVPGIPGGFTNRSGEVLFMLWSTFCIFFMRIFYLVIIASIVKAFMAAKAAVDDRESENNFHEDAADAVVSAFRRWRSKWPAPGELLARMQPDMEELTALADAGKPNAFTSVELRRLCPELSPQDAEAMCTAYSRKVRENGHWPLWEHDKNLLWTEEEIRAIAEETAAAARQTANFATAWRPEGPGPNGEKGPPSFHETLRSLGEARDAEDGKGEAEVPRSASAEQVEALERRQERIEKSLDDVVQRLSRISENISRGVALQSSPRRAAPTFCNMSSLQGTTADEVDV